ncbi:MAG: TonB-dependent receptor [Gammaproteobacteria bacterium]|nr:TonB-dependent receptor [Gammaproteobacteria bacterium]
MKHSWRKGLVTLAVSAAMGFSSVALADVGALKVRIVDAEGKPVAGATVFVQTPESLVKKSAVSDANGVVRLMGLEPSAKYSVEISGEGYQQQKVENVLVISGKTMDISYVLEGADAAERMEVTGRRISQIDTSSATVATDLTLDLVDSLPTGRSYQSYLQLVPGTKPSKDSNNPSSKSGVNFSDIGGTTGESTDNVYYLDGINVTDGVSGVAGADINSEIIQEQQVYTGAVPAEFEGGSGLVSRVTTKSGGNEFSGSVNYYVNNSDMVAKDKHNSDDTFDKYDTAFTLGGPIIQDRLWFFTSFQRKYNEYDVTKADSDEFMRTVDDSKDLGFLKLTGQLTDNDLVTFSYFNDPVTFSGSRDNETLNNRDLIRDRGGDKMHLEYSHSWDDLVLTVEGATHERDVSNFPKDSSIRNNVAFAPGSTPTLEQRLLGGYGTVFEEERSRDEFKLTLEYYLDAGDYGTHNFKTGYTRSKQDDWQNETLSGGVSYTSIGDSSTLGQYVTRGWVGSRSIVAADFGRIISAMANSPDNAFYLGLLDGDNDGAISTAELRALDFNSTTGNPYGQTNVYRTVEMQANPVTLEIEGQSFYLQDQWQLDQLTVTAGVRGERWEHIDSNGNTAFTFDWKWAPRLGAAYDLFGDGRTKVTGFVGRYYDPVRGNMTDFAGNLTGPVRDEQIFVNDRWLTFRTRGGATTPDALFAPTTKTPYTDEFLVGFAQSLTDSTSLEVTYTKRKTRDLLEDYDLELYTEAAAGTAFELPLGYFGYSEMPNSNYVIATLAGGKRDYQGVEVTFRKRKSDNWQMLASYTYNDAEGNTNSDSNADFQGDWVALDPRAPNMYGKQPGNIEHQFKVAGTYFWDMGLELGGFFNWNSGIRYSRTQLLSGRHLPVMDDESEVGGFTDTFVQAGAQGGEVSDAYYTLDMRLKYEMDFADKYTAEFFLDVYNVLDRQSAISEQDLVDRGNSAYEFGEANDWVDPRTFYLGARVSF